MALAKESDRARNAPREYKDGGGGRFCNEITTGSRLERGWRVVVRELRHLPTRVWSEGGVLSSESRDTYRLAFGARAGGGTGEVVLVVVTTSLRSIMLVSGRG